MESIFMILSILVFGKLTIITQGDPCFNYNILDSADDSIRSVANKYGQLCDNTLESGWYRIISKAGERMPTTCIVGGSRCGTTSSIWMNGSYPILNVTNSVTACAASSNGNCCAYSYQIKVKNCTDYLVYNLVPVAPCFQAYCFGIELPCTTGETSENGFSPGCEPNSTSTTIRPITITSIIPNEDSTILETTETSRAVVASLMTTQHIEEISTTSLATEHISNLPQQDEKAKSPNILTVVGLTIPAVFLLIVIAVFVVVLRRKPNCLMNTMCQSPPIYEETVMVERVAEPYAEIAHISHDYMSVH